MENRNKLAFLAGVTIWSSSMISLLGLTQVRYAWEVSGLIGFIVMIVLGAAISAIAVYSFLCTNMFSRVPATSRDRLLVYISVLVGGILLYVLIPRIVGQALSGLRQD